MILLRNETSIWWVGSTEDSNSTWNCKDFLEFLWFHNFESLLHNINCLFPFEKLLL
jgi:hypothetical protein